MFRAVVQKLLVRTTLLLKDLGLDSGRPDEPGVPSDIEGVDILCEVLLARIQTWLPERPSSSITLEAWYPTLYHVVQLLRKSKTEDLLPRSWAIATTAKLRELIPSHYETRVVDALSETGDPVSDQVASLYQYHEQRDPPQTATREEHVLYGTVACTLLEDVSNASNQPYLRAIASLSLSIMETVRANYPWSSSPFQFKIMLISDRMTTNQQACVEMTERACELVCAIINVCRDSEAEFAPTMARSIAQFSQMLKRVLKFVRGHVKAAFWLRLLYSEQHAELIAKYNAGLKDALNVFGVRRRWGDSAHWLGAR
ncbi:hypothetical protein C8R44DRAFT_95604 [Mycena epipterygia]|nr:hypothetical protein C8R44DRAFT_95604 [Mycena epipterygia]